MSMNEHHGWTIDVQTTAERRAARSQECRECHVICERVVSPWRCVRGGRTCVYAYSDGESTYIGCLHKVFSPELDLSAFEEQNGANGRGDPYGMVRVARAPRPQCPVSIERAYSFESLKHCCINPGFLKESFSVGQAPDVGRYTGFVGWDELGY